MAYPTKMIIASFADADFHDKKAQYEVRVNPEKYSQSFEIVYDKSPAIGSMNTALKFKAMPPANLKFELLFDATGAIEDSATDLAAEIKKFQNVVYNYDGGIHEPRYLMLFWGKLAFGARLTSLALNYTMFGADGAPLRARADVSFSCYQSPATIKKAENKQSPDITHRVITRAGDTLPVLTYRIYGDVRYYIQVAQFNQLVEFRDIPSGTELLFPPID